MRQVRTCDFCGDDASGLYEPLPESIPDGPRLLLCDGCRDRLLTVIDPLLDRGEGETGTSQRPGTAGNPDSQDDTRPPESGPAASEAAAPAETAPEPPSASATPTSVSESRDASGRPQQERAGTPPGYRKVMRFLENRQLPVERAEAEELAAAAYDLDADTVAAAIDHAVEYGRLRQVDGQLKQ